MYLTKYILLSIFTLYIFAYRADAQEYTMEGSLILNGQNVPIEFFIEVNEQKITGTSLTGRGRDYETLSTVEGYIDMTSKRIYLSELKDLRTKIDRNEYIVCFIRDTFSFKEVGDLILISGSFQGYTDDGQRCARGTMMITGSIDLVKKNKVEESIPNPDTAQKVYQIAEVSPNPSKLDTVRTGMLKGNNTYVYTTNSSKLDLELNDFSNFDGDSIAVLLNRKVIRDNIYLTPRLSKVSIPLRPGETDTIRLHVINEGRVSPNTSSLNFYDLGRHKYYNFMVNGLKDEEVILLILKE